MSRIEGVLKALKGQGRKALIPYITAGDPHPDVTVDLMHTLVEAGADIIELGVPFSDPMADGPVIQLACERALVHGTSLRQVIAMVKEFRKSDDATPVVLMGYLNPMEAMGYEFPRSGNLEQNIVFLLLSVDVSKGASQLDTLGEKMKGKLIILYG